MKKLFTHIGLILALAIPFLATSCVVDETPPPPPPPRPAPVYFGPDGRPGYAFFGLDYDFAEPTYLATNNQAIPRVFYYGDFYNTFPGVFDFYYEGFIIDGPFREDYFWEGTYEIWLNAGEPGYPNGVPGRDGVDSYLMLVCNPGGPIYERTNKKGASGMNIILDEPDHKIVEYKVLNQYIKFDMKKLSKSMKHTFNAEDQIIGQQK